MYKQQIRSNFNRSIQIDIDRQIIDRQIDGWIDRQIDRFQFISDDEKNNLNQQKKKEREKKDE